MYSNYKDKLIRSWNISSFLVGLVLEVSVYGFSSVFCLLTSNMTNDVWVDDADGVFWRRTKNVRIIGLWLTHFAHQISFWPKGMQYRFITAFKYKNSHALLFTVEMAFFIWWVFFSLLLFYVWRQDIGFSTFFSLILLFDYHLGWWKHVSHWARVHINVIRTIIDKFMPETCSNNICIADPLYEVKTRH